MEWLEFMVELLDILVVAVPLVLTLIVYIRKTAKEKNWGALVSLVIKLIAEAEEQFDKGSDKRTWVLEVAEASAKEIDYDFDAKRVGELIDNFCEMSKKVNTKKE